MELVSTPRHRHLLSFGCFLAACVASCGRPTAAPTPVTSASAPPTSALRIALAAVGGDTALDRSLAEAQTAVGKEANVGNLERLAARFIGKARVSGDPGFYKQAEACAEAMAGDPAGDSAAMLVRGHVRHALHDFAGAETIARDLVARRGMFLDHGLLGDVLLDQGRTDEARAVYQKMLDLKPCLQSYARAAQLHWVGGDLAGCRELLADAAGAGSRRDPESLAWVAVRQAVLELQAGDLTAARSFAEQALRDVADYPAALCALGRVDLAAGDAAAAADAFAKAVLAYPLPEYLWGEAEAARLAGRSDQAARAANALLTGGEREDPRTFALWLATVDTDAPRALRLAEQELSQRRDAWTQDAVAFARFRSGDVAGAEDASRAALAGGVCDPRIALHAALIADARGDADAARRHAATARDHRAALLPSELALLAQLPQSP